MRMLMADWWDLSQLRVDISSCQLENRISASRHGRIQQQSSGYLRESWRASAAILYWSILAQCSSNSSFIKFAQNSMGGADREQARPSNEISQYHPDADEMEIFHFHLKELYPHLTWVYLFVRWWNNQLNTGMFNPVYDQTNLFPSDTTLD